MIRSVLPKLEKPRSPRADKEVLRVCSIGSNIYKIVSLDSQPIHYLALRYVSPLTVLVNHRIGRRTIGDIPPAARNGNHSVTCGAYPPNAVCRRSTVGFIERPIVKIVASNLTYAVAGGSEPDSRRPAIESSHLWLKVEHHLLRKLYRILFNDKQ